MKLINQNILFFTRTMGNGGTEKVILQLCRMLKPYVNKIIVCSSGGLHVNSVNDLGIKHYMCPDIQNKSLKTFMETSKILKRIVKKENITVIHSHHRMAAFYTELLFKDKIIKIATAHTVFSDKKLLTRYIYRNTHIIAVGKKVKESLVKTYRFSTNKVKVIYNAIDPLIVENIDSYVDTKEIQGNSGSKGIYDEICSLKQEGNVIIGNISRLSEEKGVEYFIKAIKYVIKICPKSKFYIVGDGSQRQFLENMAHELLPEGVVEFLGYRSDIQNLMKQLDIIVLSSLFEGLPLTPIEAFSVGKPVVATSVGGTPEIVEDGKNGLLVESMDVKGLALAMIEMILDSDKRKYFGVDAYNKYNCKFSYEKMKKEYINYYRNIIINENNRNI